MTTPAGARGPVAGSLLAALPGIAATELSELGTGRVFESGRVLLREGELSTHVYLLLDGLVKVTATTPEGGFALLAIRAGGDLVGELAGLDGQPRSATVTAAGSLTARVISEPVFNDFLGRNADAAVAVSRSMAGKLRWATRRRIDFSGCEVRIRLARILVELAATYGEQGQTGIRVAVSLTQPELAALVGAAEPTVHQALAGFRRTGLIRTGYRSVEILDLPALRAVATGQGERAAGNPADTG
jgi:CRP/FNR family transcriptional regulator, cyclic AMP receptor protein